MRCRSLATAVLALALVALPSAGAGEHPAHPIYQRLKAYRNYFHVTGHSPLAHRFTVYFRNVDSCRAEVAANTVEEVQAMGEEDLRYAWGGICLPPPSLPPVPAEVAPLAEAFAARIREVYPGSTDVQVAYTARLRTVSFEELTSYSANPDPARRTARRAQLTMGAEEGSTELRPLGIELYGGLGIFVPHGPEASVMPAFVDYRTPPAIEGSSLAYAAATLGDEAHRQAWQEVSARLIATATALEQGSYENPIEALLEAQGDTLLPPGFDPWVSYEVRTYARTEDFQDQVDEGPEFRFRLREALAGEVTSRWSSAETGLDYSVTLSLASGRLRIRVANSRGDALDLAYAVTGEFLRSGDDVAVENAWLTVEPGDQGFDHSLPGTGAFTEFDVYPDSNVQTTRVFVPQPGRHPAAD